MSCGTHCYQNPSPSVRLHESTRIDCLCQSHSAAPSCPAAPGTRRILWQVGQKRDGLGGLPAWFWLALASNGNRDPKKGKPMLGSQVSAKDVLRTAAGIRRRDLADTPEELPSPAGLDSMNPCRRELSLRETFPMDT